MKKLTELHSECNCGGEPGTHEVDTGYCLRKIAPVPPRDLGNGYWLIWENGQRRRVTEFTMRQQLGYAQHGTGRWSHSGTTNNSLPDET